MQTKNEFTYKVEKNGEATIEKYIGDCEKITVPSNIDGHPVTALSSFAFSIFSDSHHLKKVTLSDNLKAISSYAFSGCDALEDVVIPNSVTEIGWSAFKNCSSLKSINIPASVTDIGHDVFDGCVNLHTISVAENNPVYADIDGVLFNKAKTKLLYLPLGKRDYILPKKTTELDAVFSRGNENLTSITLPTGLTKIHPRAFENCPALENIYADESNQVFSDIDGVLYSKDKTKIVRYPCGRAGDYILPDSVSVIGLSAFYESRFARITTLDRYNEQKSDAYANSTTLILPGSVRIIASHAFAFCNNLESISLPEGIESIKHEAFWEGPIVDVELPMSLTEMDAQAFFVCEYLSDESWERIRSVNKKADIYGPNLLNVTFSPGGIAVSSRADDDESE